MASSLLALIDDIASVLDDVALLTRAAAQKTAGVVGDDLALNAQQLTGIAAERELPVVWAVGKGSLRNKAILVPLALILSVLLPWAITPLLMLGGTYLCFEGFEKLFHAWQQRRNPPNPSTPTAALPPPKSAAVHSPVESAAVPGALHPSVNDLSAAVHALEQEKIRGAIRTDFVLSAEIIVLTLGTVQGSPWTTQLAVLTGVAVLMTVGVYGLVAAIVKLDDVGLHLSLLSGAGRGRALQRALGRWLLAAAPRMLKGLAVVGTAAMFMVGGGILLHGVAEAWHTVQWLLPPAVASGGQVWQPGPWSGVLSPLADLVAGLCAGALAVAVAAPLRRFFPASH